MVRTGRRAATLRDVLIEAGWTAAPAPPPPRLHALEPVLRAAVAEQYEAFGGCADPSSLRPGAWDLAFEGGVVVELDEELHFNRYRLATLAAKWTEPLPWRATYMTLCVGQEKECLRGGRWGRRWANPSCEAHFGAAGTPGTFDGAGSPRWKQRALYDAIKDAACLSGTTTRLARVSTHDPVGRATLGAALDGDPVVTAADIADLVRRRTFSLRAQAT